MSSDGPAVLVLRVRVNDPESGSSVEHAFLRSPVRVGRGELNELQLDRSYVSSWHGLIHFDADGIRFMDLGSTNGTFVDGVRLQRNEAAPVAPGQQLAIGRLRLELSCGAADADAEARPVRQMTNFARRIARPAQPPSDAIPSAAASALALLARAPRPAPVRPFAPPTPAPPSAEAPPTAPELPAPAVPEPVTPSSAAEPLAPAPVPDLFAAPAPDPFAPAPAPDPFAPAPAPDLFAPAPAPDLFAPAPVPDLFAPAPVPDLFAPAPVPDLFAPAPVPDLFAPAPAPDLFAPAPAPLDAPTRPPASPPAGSSLGDETLDLVRSFAESYLGPEAVPTSAAGVQRLLETLAEVLETTVRGYLELRGGHEQFGEEMGLRVPKGDGAIGRIGDTNRLLRWLLEPAEGEARARQLAAAFADLMIHQVALLNGIRAGAQALLAELSPSDVARQLERDGRAGVPIWPLRELALLRALEERHREFADEESAVVDVLFGKEFARAYSSVTGRRASSSGDSPSIARHPTAKP